MLILNERNPKISLYYLGSVLLNFLISQEISRIHLSDLYEKFNSYHSVSFNRFMLALDWLFILGKIKQAENGVLECI